MAENGIQAFDIYGPIPEGLLLELNKVIDIY